MWGGVRVRHGTPQFIPQWGPDSERAVPSTFWIALPKGQRKYPARSQQSRPAGTRASALLGTHMSPPGPPCRDPGDPSTHQSNRFGLSQPFVGVPNAGLTIRSPHNGDKHHGSHEDIEEREPPAEEQQVEDIPTRHRGPWGRGSTGWDPCHLQRPKSMPSPHRVVPKASHLRSPG